VALTSSADAFDRNPRLDEALQFLNGPDFIPAQSQPVQVEFNGPLDFHFPTPRPSEFPENNMVHGRFYRCGERWQEKPVVILLHGAGDPLTYNFLFPRVSRRCHQAGFNAATLVAPYQLRRRPRQLGGARGYSDCLQFAEGTAQAIAEIRAFTGWLLAQGCPAVALWGYSQGAWYAGMTACRDERLTSVVLGAPCAYMRPWVAERAFVPRIHKRLPEGRKLCESLNLTPMNLTLAPPVIPGKNILLIEGIHELICPKDDVEDLWQSWGQPDIWRLPHGHVGVCCGLVPGLNGRVLRWLAPRLNAPAGGGQVE
jgi:pimeloyl-ACP methyl ester carboxylesterase